MMRRYFALLCLLATAPGCGIEPHQIVTPRPSTSTGPARVLAPAGTVGPRICFSSEILDHCFPEGGYCLCEEGVVPTDIPAGRTLTVNWNADPQPGTSVRWYRWAVDIKDVKDETPRVDEATDLAHWSQRSATPSSAQLGPWSVGEEHVFYLEVEDDFGLRSLGRIRFTVVPSANRPPECGRAVPDRASLWPPNHQLVPVDIRGVSDPDGDPVAIRVTRVTQDEPPIDGAANAGNSAEDENGLPGDPRGRHRTCPDAVIHEDGRVSLRAERSARGNGRVYTIWFTASDPAGASCEGSVRVCVPRDRRHGECGDGPQVFDSLGPCREGGVLQPLAPAVLAQE